MHAIRTGDEEAEQYAACRMLQIAKPWTIRRSSESKLADGNPVVQILKYNSHLIDLEWTVIEQAQLKTLVERCTSWDVSGAWMVHRWWLACFSLLLGDTKGPNDVSGQWSYEWPLDAWVDSLIFQSLREIFLPMADNRPAECPDTDLDEESCEELLPVHKRNEHSLPSAPSL